MTHRYFLGAFVCVYYVWSGGDSKCAPRSMKESKYINARIGINLRSTFCHNLFSCSGVSLGGRGKAVSPPKSMSSDGVPARFSSIEGVNSFLSDMLAVNRREGKRMLPSNAILTGVTATWRYVGSTAQVLYDEAMGHIHSTTAGAKIKKDNYLTVTFADTWCGENSQCGVPVSINDPESMRSKSYVCVMFRLLWSFQLRRNIMTCVKCTDRQLLDLTFTHCWEYAYRDPDTSNMYI